jgi:hypothetical protein
LIPLKGLLRIGRDPENNDIVLDILVPPIRV